MRRCKPGNVCSTNGALGIRRTRFLRHDGVVVDGLGGSRLIYYPDLLFCGLAAPGRPAALLGAGRLLARAGGGLAVPALLLGFRTAGSGGLLPPGRHRPVRGDVRAHHRMRAGGHRRHRGRRGPGAPVQAFRQRLDGHCRNAIRNVASDKKYVTLDLYLANGGKSLGESPEAPPRTTPSPPGGATGRYPSPEELKPTARGFEYRADDGDARIAFDDHGEAGWSSSARWRGDRETVVYGDDFEEVYRKTRERIDAARAVLGLDPIAGPSRPASTEAIGALVARRDRLLEDIACGEGGPPPPPPEAPSRDGREPGSKANMTKPRANSSKKS